MSTSARQLPVTKTRKHRYAALPPHADRVFKVAHGVKVQLRVFPAFGYEDTDGVSTAPVDWGPKGAPWLLWFHGGGLFLGHHVAPYPWVLPSFLSRGYHVVSASYRLAPHASLREILDDNAAALAFCRAELPAILRDMAAELGKLPQAAAVDIDTYVLGGDSAGGTLALIGGHLLRPRPAAIIESCAVTDLINYHPTSPAAYPPSGAFPDAELRALLAERDPRKAVIAAPYLSEIPPPLGMGRLPRPQLGAVWGASDGPVHDGPHGPEADFSEEEVRFAAMRNDAANLALRDRLTIPTLFRAEKYNSLPELTDAVIELCPLHLLGGMGCPPTETSREYPPTYILHGTHDSGVPMHEAKRYAARLTELRRPVGLKVVEGKGHAFDIWAAPGHALWPTMQHGVDFVDQHVRAARKDPSARL